MRILAVAAILSFPALTLFTFFAGSDALAQSVGPDEVVGPSGVVDRALPLTATQKSALYHTVLRQGARAATAQIDPTVGATVPRSVQLPDLPSQSSIDQGNIDEETAFKYAMVQGDLVVVDPIRMRVVEVIHGSTRP